MSEMNALLEPFKLTLEENIMRMWANGGNQTYSLCVINIPKFSPGLTLSTGNVLEPFDSISIHVKINLEEAQVKIDSSKELDKWDISFSTQMKERMAARKYIGRLGDSSLYRIPYFFASVEGEDFKKLQNNPCIITCRMMHTKSMDPYFAMLVSRNVSIPNNSSYLKALEDGLKKCPSKFSKEKVVLRVNEETEIVNKALLCARSTVFAKMFENELREQNQNTVTITDIKMPVLKALVSFLCNGILRENDFDILCDLYYAADKYDILELQQACIRLLLSKIHLGNIIRVLKLSALHNDEFLQSTTKALISANNATVLLTSYWKELMCDDPELAVKAYSFYFNSNFCGTEIEL